MTVPSFTALAALFPDYQNLTYVKQQKVALPLGSFFILGFRIHTFFLFVRARTKTKTVLKQAWTEA